MVASRWLTHFGRQVEVLYPKKVEKPELFPGLISQLEDLKVNFVPELPKDFETKYDLIIDGVFGFSFNPERGIRPPFDTVLNSLRDTKVPICSVDIPSGKMSLCELRLAANRTYEIFL